MRAKTAELIFCLALLPATLASTCDPVANCENGESCSQNLSVLEATPRLSKSEGGTFVVTVDNPKGDITTGATLLLLDASGQELASTPLGQIESKEPVHAKFSVLPDKLRNLPVGPLSLSVTVAGTNARGNTQTRLYVKPILSTGAVLEKTSLATSGEEVLSLESVFIQPASGQLGWLFLGQHYKRNMNIYRRIQRRQCRPCNNTQCRQCAGMMYDAQPFTTESRLSGQDPAVRFAVGQTTVAVGWRDAGTSKVRVFGQNANADAMLDKLPDGSNSVMPLFAADPDGDTLALATPSKLQLYTVKASGTTISQSLSGTCALPPEYPPIALLIQPVDTAREKLRRAIVVGSNGTDLVVKVCELPNATQEGATTVLRENTPLADCLKSRLEKLPRKNAVLALGDLDADGLADLVYVPNDSTSHIDYAPYAVGPDPNRPLGTTDCPFWPTQRAALPEAAPGTVSLAVGDLDGDLTPDVAMTTSEKLFVFKNKAK